MSNEFPDPTDDATQVRPPQDLPTENEPTRVLPGPGDKVEISWTDLQQPDVADRVQRMQDARQIPLVRSVGTAPQQATGFSSLIRGSLGGMILSGIVGGFLAWGMIELILQPESEDPWYGDGKHTSNILFSLVIGLGIGLVIAAWDGIQARSWAKTGRSMGLAAIALVLIGLLGGYIASLIYQSMTESIGEDAFEHAQDVVGSPYDDPDAFQEAFFNYISSHLHLPRGIAIGIVGLCVGAAIGLASLSWKRALNGAIGGVVGGFLGGFLFDYIAKSDSDNAVVPRLVAVVLVGFLIGVLTGLIELARRDHWLEIVTGGMAGKQFILYHNETLIGSASDAAVTLIKDPGVAPRHAVLRRSGGDLIVTAIDPMAPVLVNGLPVQTHKLQDSEMMQFGSSIVRYRAKEAAAPVSNQIYG